MNSSSSFRRPATGAGYYFWVGVFLLGLLAVCGFLYYATLKIDYVWRWYRIPQYFVYEDTVEIKSDISGSVAALTQEGENALIRIQETGGGEATFRVPARPKPPARWA